MGPWLLVGFNDFNKDGKWWERAGKSPGFTKATPQAISASITLGLKQQDEGGGTNAAGKCLLINQIAYERTETARNGKKERELWMLVRNKHFNKMGSV